MSIVMFDYHFQLGKYLFREYKGVIFKGIMAYLLFT